MTLWVNGGSTWGPTVGSTYTTVATLPEGYRPVAIFTSYSSPLSTTATKPCEGRVTDDGNVQIRNMNGDSGFYCFCCTYVTVDPWPA